MGGAAVGGAALQPAAGRAATRSQSDPVARMPLLSDVRGTWNADAVDRLGLSPRGVATLVFALPLFL